MKRKLIIIAVLVAVLAVWGMLRGGGEKPPQVEFSAAGLEILFDVPRELNRISVYDQSGQPITVAVIGPGARQKIPVFFKWEAGRHYLLELLAADGGKQLVDTLSPSGGRETAALLLQAPYGVNQAGGVGMVPAGGPMTANLLLTHRGDKPVDVQVDIRLPEGFELLAMPNGFQQEERDGTVHLTGARRMAAKNENWNEQLQLKAGETSRQAVIEATAVLNDGSAEWSLKETARLEVAPVAEISGNVRIQALELPVDAAGRFDPKARPGALVYTPPSRIAVLLGAQTEHSRLDDEPFAYSCITLANDSEQQVLVLVAGKVLDVSDGKLAAAFTSPPHKNAGLGYSYSVASLPPRSASQVVLPIYLNENAALVGNYRLYAEACVFGTRQVISTVEKPVYLSTRNDRPVIVTMLMMLTAIAAIGWLLWRREGALARFSTKEMVIVSLFGTATFVTVNLPSTVLWDIAHVVFGPFSFLVTGFFNQTVLFTLMVSLAVLVPRPGAVALMVAVRMILNGFIFGHFTPAQILSYVMLALCLEAGLYLTGVTRGRRQAWTGVAGLALVCGLVDVVTTYMNFMAYMTLYRLFYADWYIGAVALAGFFYTAAGAAVGHRLGSSLKRTAMD